MHTISLSETTYHWLRRYAKNQNQTPDQVADTLLREQLLPHHAYIENVVRLGGKRAMIKGTRIAVTDIVGYLRVGETPETIANDVLPLLSLAQVYDALSYYHTHQEEIDAMLAEDAQKQSHDYLKQHLDEEDYRQITGQGK